MYRLVRNYGVDIPSPTKGWGKKPDICKKEIGDDLERIRSYRNKVKHATEETDVMDEDDFDIQWNDLKQVSQRRKGLCMIRAQFCPPKLMFAFLFQSEVYFVKRISMQVSCFSHHSQNDMELKL